MEKSITILDNKSATNDQETSNLQDSKNLLFQSDLQDLLHASHCRKANCKITRCLKVNRIVNHIKTCNSGANLSCLCCKQLAVLIISHAKNCRQEAKCTLPSCIAVKNKLREIYLQQRLKQSHILKRGRAAVQNCLAHTAVPQTSSDNFNSSCQPATGSHPNSLLHLSQSSIGIKRPTASPARFLQTFREIPTAAAMPTASCITAPNSVNSEKGNSDVCPTANPALMESQQMEAQEQKSMSPLMNIPNQATRMSNVACLEGTNLGQTPQPHHNPQLHLSQPIRLKPPSRFIWPRNVPNKSKNLSFKPLQRKANFRQFAPMLVKEDKIATLSLREQHQHLLAIRGKQNLNHLSHSQPIRQCNQTMHARRPHVPFPISSRHGLRPAHKPEITWVGYFEETHLKKKKNQ